MMASRVILQKKKCLLDSVKRPHYLAQRFVCNDHGRLLDAPDSQRGSWPVILSHSDNSENEDSHSLTRQMAQRTLPKKYTGHYFSKVPSFHREIGVPGEVSPLGFRWTIEYSRHLSTAPAGKPELEGGDNIKESVKAKKEPSPEECDQAVEGLSSVKAKAKAKEKQLQDSSKGVKFILKKVQAILLGIGPALRAIASMSREDWANKLRHWKDEFKSTMQHYWLGTKLLWVDVRISLRLLLKLASGKTLSRRERQQLTRTTADIFRLVPFAVFILVPFMEFLLPVFLKLFPNMLPSTFQDKMKEQEALKKRLNARIEYAKFLQETVKEMAKEVQSSRSGDIKKTAEDLDDFMSKVRKGAPVTNEEILGFAKLFNDEFTLDNISRPRIMTMCKYMGISTYGTDAYLRYMLRDRLRKIKTDDKMIQAEGIESLSEEELRQACRERGLLGLLSVEEMRKQLQDWLDLSLNHSVPSSLLILSRAFSVSGKVRPEEAVQATLSSLPDEVVDTVGITSLPSEDSVAERRRKLEFLEMQEELIKEEEEREEKEEEEQGRLKESVKEQKDVALEEMVDATAKEVQERDKAKSLDKDEQLSELSRALAVLASASSVTREREEFLSLVQKEVELYNHIVEEGTDGEAAAKKAYIEAREEIDHDAEKEAGDKVASALINRVDAMLQKLEKEIDDVDAKIGDRWRLLDRDYDGKVTPEEVASAATYLKATLDKEGIQEFISKLSKDRDGKILVEDIVKLAKRSEDDENAEDGKP
ncbi:mitochondrial proton/calcium exchanger protein-like [Salvia splendens]|uniref:mitochondrial proton/calcium exchanger protein-like n=1 Tax=Salvia splendens TaxID=180675 RepID=UPI001C272C5C|nr:mitochondrial proton/calcium exchanger protein-like [Salvia splendens]XP_042004189.1 mitochondrial proton/calcium exchanger protein-like [Salvia splendens]XP_042004190.1 mitochondrial proton/calcium exchanger protein-like [Salvia splendens]